MRVVRMRSRGISSYESYARGCCINLLPSHIDQTDVSSCKRTREESESEQINQNVAHDVQIVSNEE